MYLYLEGHTYHFECENLCRVFFPYEAILRTAERAKIPEGTLCAGAVITNSSQGYNYEVWILEGEKSLQSSKFGSEKNEYQLTSLLFLLFRSFTAYRPQWGMLTGIHPVKLLREYCASEGTSAALDRFKHQFFVSENKLELAQRTLNVQHPFIRTIHDNDVCLYVGIPFCPTKCAYCSFVSQSIEKTKKLVAPFFDLLLLELEKTSEVIQKLDLSLTSIYVGGGTPTTLNAAQLKILCEHFKTYFDLSHCAEITVEAGRPDTITEEKLTALMQGGVTRISINPQSLSDQVLERIGRAHTAEQVRTAFDTAKKTGFTSINSDLIVGLPGDDLRRFQNTLEGVIGMGATNVTVHALALKRASAITGSGDFSSHKNQQLANEMMEYAYAKLTEMRFAPYYMYRQTKMAGNLENTGWCREDDVCRYNIYTMDESVSIIACGAGGVTKLKAPGDRRLERIFNFKYPHEYIARHEEILKRKDGVIRFYEQFC